MKKFYDLIKSEARQRRFEPGTVLNGVQKASANEFDDPRLIEPCSLPFTFGKD